MTTYRITNGIVSGDSKLVGSVELTPVAKAKPTTAFRDVYGVCSHPNFDNEAYGDPNAWTQKLVNAGIQQFRGMFAFELDHVRETLALSKQRNLKWLATVASLDKDFTEKKLIARLTAIAADLATDPNSPIIAIEGVNEPEKDTLTDTKVARVVKYQKIIWEFVKDHDLDVVVLAPALKQKASRATYQRFVDAGIKGLFHAVSVHHYNGPDAPSLTDLKIHLDMIQSEWGCNRFWITETGYTNALMSKDPRKATEAVAAVYALPNVLTFLLDDRVEKVFQYELSDDKAGLLNNEAHFGMWRIDGSAKPCVGVMAAWQMSVREDDPEFDPPEVDLEIVAPDGVEHILVGNDGLTTLWLWRPEAQFDVAPVDVSLTTSLGIATVHVGAAPIGVPIQ